MNLDDVKLKINEINFKLDSNNLIPAIIQDNENNEVLMIAYMSMESLAISINEKRTCFWSRSRKCLWHKGATSGLIQKVIDIRIDDDQDAIWLKVELQGLEASCHVGYKSCFYRSIPTGNIKEDIKLIYKEDKKAFKPEEVYGDAPNPTKL